MGRNVASLPDGYVDQLTREADALGLSRNKYVRQRLEAGRLLFQSSDKLNTETLNGLIDQDSAPTIDNGLETPEGDIADKLLANLPADESQALEQDELREVVFGTRAEQMEAIETALRELNERGQVEPAFDGGYMKTNE
ncbi:hypothetical protein PNP59_04285 [Halobacterium salinarum]|uniref:hypothetical protein n=1 Tax=Halobacterium salinarum TaxID=2242 RepID=UPI00255260DF|nr:hypothetical protein [Halobacterium salinarum]MDL0130156.1 hypothetical protein [Halobacterium salinarum]